MRSKDYSLKERLLKYSALASATLVSTQLPAAVIYTDITDVVLSSQSTHFLDIDNNGVNDFQFIFNTGTYSKFAYVNPLGNDVLATETSSYAWYAVVNNFGNVIGGLQGQWNSSSQQYIAGIIVNTISGQSYTWSFGYWAGAVDKYLGVRINAGNGWHYGWIRMDVDPMVNNITIKDFAYESSLNQSILAGDMGLVGAGMEAMLDDISIHCSNKVLRVNTGNHLLNDARLERLPKS